MPSRDSSMTHFQILSVDWNAEPNAPNVHIAAWDADLLVTFYLNAFQFGQYSEGDIGVIRFRNCSRYRFGPTNDEGWYRGQCRFSKLAPRWGEFYEVSGDLRLESCPKDWTDLFPFNSPQRHFLFYFKDGQFECDASEWKLTVL